METLYAKSGDVHVAYQVHGNSERDLIWAPSYFSHLEMQMAQPSYARFVRALSAFARVILFDKRGTGMSDPVTSYPTLDERMDDLRAVLDAAGSDHATMMGTCEGGALATLFAATHPERVDGLVLCNSFARATSADGYPWGIPPEQWDSYVESLTSVWGEGRFLELFAPSAADDASVQEWWRRYQRLGVSPGGLRSLMNMNAGIDITHVLGAVRVPTLVLHAEGDRICSVDEGRFLADHIPGSRFVELPSSDHYPWFAIADAVAAEVEQLMTGSVLVRDVDRSFMTVLFFDVVDSTKVASSIGDKRWRSLLEELYNVTRIHLRGCGGREIKTLGDGMMVVFDRPSAAVHAATAIASSAASLGVQARAGIHCGDCEICGDDVAGLTVHIAARIMALATGGEVLCSRSVVDVAEPDLEFGDRGMHELKGVPGEWRTYAVAI